MSRVVLSLLVILGVGSSVVAWEDRGEATVAPAEIVAQLAQTDRGAPAPAPIARAELAPPVAPPPLAIEVEAPAATVAQPPLSLAPKTSPPRC